MEVTQKALAECLGISARQIRNLKEAGMFQLPEGKKKYHLESCIQEYIEYKVNDVTGSKAVIDKEKVSAEHEEIKKQIAILKLRKMRRELHEAQDVERFLSDMLIRFKNRLLAIPAKAAMQVIGLTDANEVIDIITKVIREAIEELSDYDPDAIDDMDSGSYEELFEEEEEE